MSAPAAESRGRRETIIEVRGLEMAYDSFVVMRELDFTVNRGDIFIIMGGAAPARAPC